MEAQDYNQRRLDATTMKEIDSSPSVQSGLDNTLTRKENNLKYLKARTKIGGFLYKIKPNLGKSGKIINKSLNSKAVYKNIGKKSNATVNVGQPVYIHDKSRFFKDNYEEEKRSLFFS